MVVGLEGGDTKPLKGENEMRKWRIKDYSSEIRRYHIEDSSGRKIADFGKRSKAQSLIDAHNREIEESHKPGGILGQKWECDRSNSYATIQDEEGRHINIQKRVEQIVALPDLARAVNYMAKWLNGQK